MFVRQRMTWFKICKSHSCGTTQAAKDLEGIWFYSYQTWPEQQADRCVEILEATFVNLSFMPEQARELLEFDPPVHIVPCAKHIVVYRIDTQANVILRVLRAKQDLATILHSLYEG